MHGWHLHIRRGKEFESRHTAVGWKIKPHSTCNKDVRKSVPIPRDNVKEEILKRLDEGKSHVIQADIGSYLIGK